MVRQSRLEPVVKHPLVVDVLPSHQRGRRERRRGRRGILFHPSLHIRQVFSLDIQKRDLGVVVKAFHPLEMVRSFQDRKRDILHLKQGREKIRVVGQTLGDKKIFLLEEIEEIEEIEVKEWRHIVRRICTKDMRGEQQTQRKQRGHVNVIDVIEENTF